MRTRPPQRGDRDRLFATLGVAALVVIATIGYISYTALGGLPFQERRHVVVEVPNAERLVAADDVRIGGVRVGQVARIQAEPAAAGRAAFARLRLALNGSVGPLPSDTTVRVRPASVLGASYVELRPGRSATVVPDDGVLPLARATATIDVVDLFDVFDERARRSFRGAVGGLAGGLAARGPALNTSIAAIGALTGPLTEVAGTLAAADTRLARFLASYETMVQGLAPVAPDLGRLVAGGSATFAALARERPALAATLEGLAPSERAATEALRAAQPGLEGLARLSRALRPGARLLPAGLDAGNDALTAGVLPLRRLPALAPVLQRTFASLHALSRRPSTGGALRKLTDLMRASGLSLEVLAPAQKHCNIIALLGQNYSSFTGTLGVGHGPSFWNFPVSTTGAQSDNYQAKEPAPNLGVNYTPNENAEECESGNEDAPGDRRAIGNPAGRQAATTRDTDPPPGVRERARAAGLLDDEGSRP